MHCLTIVAAIGVFILMAFAVNAKYDTQHLKNSTPTVHESCVSK